MKNLFYLFLAVTLFSCSDDEGNPCVYEPILTTQAATDITETSATLNGVISIVSENCEVPNNTEQGFVYSTEIQPALEGIQVNVNGANISTTIEGLEPNTTYYVRAFLTNNLGDFYGDEISFMTESYMIGDFVHGGIVFWVDETGQHGLVCAVSDQINLVTWFNGTYNLSVSTGIAIGTGDSNTNNIISIQGEPEINYAAFLARAYNGGGYNDWFLPSKDELNQMYTNKATINTTASANGGSNFSINYFWSSTEGEGSTAWDQGFNVGNQGDIDKYYVSWVRAVRAF